MAGKAAPTIGRTWAETPLSTLIDLYITSKQIEGRSAKTLDWYRANLERFAEFMTNGHAATLAEASLEDARAFIAHLQGRTSRYDDHEMRPTQEGGLSPYSVHRYVRTLKAFGNWPYEEGYASAHPFAVRYLMNGGDVMTLRLILGHTSLEVTQMYLHLAESHVQVQHNRFSPVDRLGLGRRRQANRR